jgi:hypothetical protein
MSEFDRRGFLKMGANIAAGVAVGEVLFSVKGNVNRGVEEITHHPTGNASDEKTITESCKNSLTPQECAQNYQFSPKEKLDTLVGGPLVEEGLFRAVPSCIVSWREKSKNPMEDVVRGTGGFGLSRRELIGGVTSSIAFGAVHNLTTKGIDTNTIPASQTFDGMVYWYLQRKFGIVANTIAHSFNNFRSIF